MLTKSLGYRNAGTVEFLLDPETNQCVVENETRENITRKEEENKTRENITRKKEENKTREDITRKKKENETREDITRKRNKSQESPY